MPSSLQIGKWEKWTPVVPVWEGVQVRAGRECVKIMGDGETLIFDSYFRATLS